MPMVLRQLDALMQAEKKDEPMPDASAAPAENGTADAEHSAAHAAPAAEAGDAAMPMETESKEATEVVKKKRTKKHAVPYKAQGVAGLGDRALQVLPGPATCLTPAAR